MDQRVGAVTRDPVCGMTVDTEAGRPSAGGRTFHLRSERCRERFEREPAAWVEAEDPVCARHDGRSSDCAAHGQARRRALLLLLVAVPGADPDAFLREAPPAETPPEGTLWTCPMDPGIVRDGPDDCDLQHGAEADGAERGRRPEPRALRFHPPSETGGPLALAVLVLSRRRGGWHESESCKRGVAASPWPETV